MLSLASEELQSIHEEIRELHARGNAQRSLLGHPPAADIEAILQRHKGNAVGESPSAVRLTPHSLNQLTQLRDLKANELQTLILRNVGRWRGAAKVAARTEHSRTWPGSRFNVRTLLATVEALLEQHQEIKQQVADAVPRPACCVSVR